MAGYDDTRQKIINTLMGRPVGSEIQPENHQDYALNMLDYIRSIELATTSTLVGIAQPDTQPVQPDTSNVCYIAGVAQDRTVTFQNFYDYEGKPISITTGDMQAYFVVLLWNKQYWSMQALPTSVLSYAENATFYYGYNVHKTYPNVAAMQADVNNPIGNDGRYIKIGEIVSVVNGSNASENGLYSWEGTEKGWIFQGGINVSVKQEIGTSVNDVMSQYAVTKEIAHLIKLIRGTAEDTDARTDPFKQLGTFSSLDDALVVLDALHGDMSSNSGVFRGDINGILFHVESIPLSYADDIWLQSVRSNFKPDGTAIIRDENDYSIIYRKHSGGRWGEWHYLDVGLSQKPGEKFLGGTGEIFNDYIDNTAEAYGHAEGLGTGAGEHAHSEGHNTSASGLNSHAEGYNTKASGEASHAEGFQTVADENFTHSEGRDTGAHGRYSHAEGRSTHAELNAHAEGLETHAGQYGHAEGNQTTTGDTAHAEGYQTHALAIFSHTEGSETVCEDKSDCGHAEGRGSKVSAKYGHAEGKDTHVLQGGEASHCEGNATWTYERYGHAEGNQTKAWDSAHAEGYLSQAKGVCSHAEGSTSQATSDCAHAEGIGSTASGLYSHSEGSGTTASGKYSHAEGYSTKASGEASHAEGNKTQALELFAHAEGKETIADGEASHSEGGMTLASGMGSHSEGGNTQASGICSHAEGYHTIASGNNSHAEGHYTIAHADHSHAEGRYNKPHDDTRHSVGIGTSEDDRKNAFEIMDDGRIYAFGMGGYDGTNANVQGVLTIQELFAPYVHVSGVSMLELENYYWDHQNGSSRVEINAQTLKEYIPDIDAIFNGVIKYNKSIYMDEPGSSDHLGLKVVGTYDDGRMEGIELSYIYYHSDSHVNGYYGINLSIMRFDGTDYSLDIHLPNYTEGKMRATDLKIQ